MKIPRVSIGTNAVSALSALAFLLAAALPTLVRAQAATTTTTTDSTTTSTTTSTVPTSAQVQTGTANPAPAASDTVKMSPFEVQASAKDQGYYTANTLSGTRLNSSLNDLGASITVISKQQLEDTSSVNLNDMFLYEASTEGTENYTALGGFGKGTGVGDTIQTSPQTANRIRGLAPADVSRDFFITNPSIQTDVYNLDSVTISRGPNSTLFGIGSPAGIVNLTIQKAQLNQDTNEVSARYGTYGDTRASFNFNRALVPDKIAIDVAGVYQNAHPTGQEPEYDIQRREFAALTLKPFPTTTVRANIEYYDNPNQRANSITPTDEVTPWINAGRPTWDPITYTATVNGVTSAPITNNQLVPTGLGNGLGNAGVGTPQMYIVHGQIQLWEQAELGTNFAAPGTPTNAVGTINGTGVNAVVNTWGPIGFERLMNTQGNYAKFASSAPAGQVTYPLFHEAGVTNKLLLPYNSINMLSPNIGEDKAQIYNVELEQEITDNLFLDAGWYREAFTSAQHNYLGGNVGNALEVDPNTRLLNGAPNPYFGRPYTIMQQGDDIYLSDLNEQERVSLAYTLDFTKNSNWTQWLGHHNALVYYQHRENDTNSFRYRLQVIDAHSWNSTTDIGNNASGPSGSNSQRYYLSDAGNAVSYSPSTFVNSSFTFPVTWYNTALNGGTFTNESTKLAPEIFPASTSKAQQQVWSYSGGLQDYFFNDDLILTFGQRHDYERARTSVGVTVDPGTGLTDVDNLQYWNTANGLAGGWNLSGGITRQAGAVLHIPGAKWFTIHYNQSENFQVAGLAYDQFGNVLPNPTGRGKDYGFSVSLFDDKLIGEMNWYKSGAANSREGTTTFVDRALRIDGSMFIPWAQQIATNTLGVAATSTAINNFAQNIVQYPGGLTAFGEATQFEGDTQTVNATGWEANITYNPMRNWTMKFTADQDEAVYSNVYPHIQAYLASRLPVWTKATDPVLGPFWTTVSGGNFSDGGGSPQQWLNGTVDAAGLDVELAQQNHISPDLSKYQFSYLTNYQFVQGVLKGFGIGTALTYETPAAIGYYGASPDPAALGAVDGLQAFNPIKGKEVIHEDAWISYKMRMPFLDNRIRATFQLNVKDMWSNGYLQTVQVNPDGTPQAFRIVTPRRFYLTATFDF
jgi:outer membrane receptor protein involved in Fe transport